MGRIRTIKPEFPQSESMGNVTRDARLCFILLWTVADDAGRLRGNPRMLASTLFPYDIDAPSLIPGWLDELEREKCIRRYKADGHHFIEIINWLKQQKIDKPSKSRLPHLPEDIPGNSPTPPRIIDDDSPPPPLLFADDSWEEGTKEGTKELSEATLPHPARKEGGDQAHASPEEKIYQAYPRHEGKGAAVKAIEKAVERIRKGELSKPAIPSKRDAQVFLFRRVQAYARSPAGTRPDRDLIPHPSTWFNQSRYFDDDDVWRLNGTQSKQPKIKIPTGPGGNYGEAKE